MAREAHEVVFYTYPKLLFAWPVIVLGLLFYPLAAYDVVSTSVLGWIYVVTLVTVVLTMGIDVNREVAVFWIVTLIAIAAASAYLRTVGVDFLQPLVRLIGYLQPEYHPGTGLAVSVFLAVPYAVMLVWARINDRWRITHNEFEHYAFGKVDRSLARGAKTVRTAYPDLFEFLLCLAGELIIYDSKGEKVLARIEHVPLLPWVRRRIQQILEYTAVVSTTDGSEQVG